MKLKLSIIILSALFLITTPTKAILIDADDILGQIDGNGDPIWTSNASGISDHEFDIDTSYGHNNLDMDAVNHRLFLADTYNHRILIFDLDENNNLIDRYADKVLGQPDFYTQDTSSVGANTLNRPRGVAYDSVRNWLFVGETGNDRALVYDVAEITNGEDAIYVLGWKDFTATIPGDTTFDPWGLEYDEVHQRLFANDNNVSGKLQIFDVSTITNGEAAVNHLGTGVCGNNINQMCTDFSMRYDSTENRLFVGDDSNNRVLVFDLSTIINEEDAVSVLGDNGAIPAQDTITEPKGISYDEETETLFVTDYDGQRVMLFDISNGITGVMDAYNVVGQPDFISSTDSTTRATFDGPHGTYYDMGNNKLYILEEYNHRVMIFQFPNIITTPVEGMINEQYSHVLDSEGGNGPYTYSLGQGNLPTGLTLSPTGTISGTPTESGTFTFTVITEDSSYTAPETTGLKGGTELTLIVNQPITGPMLPSDEIALEDTSEYKLYKECYREYGSDSYKGDWQKIKELKRKDYATYWKMKTIYYMYRVAGDTVRDNLEKTNPETYEMYKEYRRYKKYKQCKEYKRDVF